MLRDWEQGRTEPDQPARAYLTVTPAILRACSARCRVRQSHKVKNEIEPTVVSKTAPDCAKTLVLVGAALMKQSTS
jgi:hypothetical protein